MIKLERAAQPAFLDTSTIAALTSEFELTGKAVWNNDQIKIPLLNSSNGKCAYCESPLTTASNYMEVEHFEDKKHNPKKVVEWLNLLPSCKRCNSSKLNHDTVAEPIVNPFDEDPRLHLSLRLYRIRPKTQKGETTIEVTNLNHATRLVMSRFEIGNKMAEIIDTAWLRLEKFQQTKSTRDKNRIVGIVEGMLSECVPTAPYAASTATMLLTDKKFLELAAIMKTDNIWSSDCELLFTSAQKITLDVE